MQARHRPLLAISVRVRHFYRFGKGEPLFLDEILARLIARVGSRLANLYVSEAEDPASEVLRKPRVGLELQLELGIVQRSSAKGEDTSAAS